MSQQNDGLRTMTADEAIPQFSRVVLESDGRCVVAGITEVGDGIAQTPAFAAGDPISVRLWNKTYKMIAGEALAVGATLYTEASGKVQDTAASTSFAFAKALEEATADGDIIECVLLQVTDGTAES